MLRLCFSLYFAQDHADRVLEAMNSEALEDRLQVEFVSEWEKWAAAWLMCII